MKKGILIGLMIGIILTGLTVYGAYKYQASDIEYTPENSDFKVDNVGEAINELYDKINSGITYIKAKDSDTYKGVVYMDPTDLRKTCTFLDVSKNKLENNTLTGVKTGCMKWYIFKEETENYIMILDHNVTTSMKWYDSLQMVPYTSSNTKPYVDALITESKWDSSLKPRLITAEEITEIIKFSTFNSTSSNNTYFGSLSSTSYGNMSASQKLVQQSYHWLFDYTSGCTDNGCEISDTVNGYWTSTNRSESNHWIVYKDGRLSVCSITDYNCAGVRPVVSLAKSLIK